MCCQNCSSSLSITHAFYFEPATTDEWEALASFAAEAGAPAVCPECAHEYSIDLPVSVYDPLLNRMYHYMPTNSFDRMDLTELFEFGADPSPAFLGGVFEHLRDTGAFASGIIEHRVREDSFSFRVFFSLMEVVQQAFAGAQIGRAHV